jgi:hypothetical protein
MRRSLHRIGFVIQTNELRPTWVVLPRTKAVKSLRLHGFDPQLIR